MNDLDVTKAMEPKADQLNGDDFLTGSRIVTIRDVTVDNTREQKVWIFIEGEPKKPWKPNKTYLRVLSLVWDTPNASLWIGRSLVLYRDPEVLWGGAKVGGIAVSRMSNIDKPKTIVVAKTRSTKQSITINPLVTKDAPKIDVEAVNTAAREAAAKGKASFTDWWKANATTRDMVKPIMDELKASVAAADAPAEGDDNGPSI
jgi:hypothetical protein